MADRRDRSVDVFARDGLLRKGKALGHVDERGRVREADAGLRKGTDLGVLDDRERVRRKAGFLRRGEAVGRIRGNAAYVGEGILGGGLKVGFVDDTGLVWQAECESFRSRPVGRAKGADPESALAFFLLKFCELDDAVGAIEAKVRESEEKYAFLPRVRALQRVVPEVDAIGDFDSLVRRLEVLEDACASDLGQHITGKDAWLDEAVRKKPTPESIVANLRARLPERDEAGRRVDQLVELTFGSVDRLRDELDRIRRDPEYGPEDLVESMRSAMTSVLDAGAGIAKRRDERPSFRPGADSTRPLTGGTTGSAIPVMPTPAAIPGPPRVPESVALVAVEPDVPTSRELARKLVESREAEQVFEMLDVGIERLRELEGVRKDGVNRLAKALAFVRSIRRR